MGAAPRDLHYLLHHLRRAAAVGSAWLREGSAIQNGRGGFNVGWQSGAPSHLPACVSTNHLGAGTASLSRAPEGQIPESIRKRESRARRSSRWRRLGAADAGKIAPAIRTLG